MESRSSEQLFQTRFHISWLAVKPHFISERKFSVGIVDVEIEGTKMWIYNREQTICECLTHRNKMNAEIFNSAIWGYLKDPQRNEARLGMYAATLKVQRKSMGGARNMAVKNQAASALARLKNQAKDRRRQLPVLTVDRQGTWIFR